MLANHQITRLLFTHVQRANSNLPTALRPNSIHISASDLILIAKQVDNPEPWHTPCHYVELSSSMQLQFPSPRPTPLDTDISYILVSSNLTLLTPGRSVLHFRVHYILPGSPGLTATADSFHGSS